jgi:hypothetical protein
MFGFKIIVGLALVAVDFKIHTEVDDAGTAV